MNSWQAFGSGPVCYAACVTNEAERLARIFRGLSEARQVLTEMDTTTEVELLRARLVEAELQVQTWEAKAPSRIERALITNHVLKLNLDLSNILRRSREGD